ncbi:hypothetical protein B0H15DRAFT_1021703 [Mycena belliarum]|uniref:Uncharacterized protein n=1 Tax=Mycena belliarum TaxID=1033014 RepID=A0AAD6UAF8_9AGAR|nr:hypothetical protein B0H15DRAFT_1021703 [Mycena belliae]
MQHAVPDTVPAPFKRRCTPTPRSYTPVRSAPSRPLCLEAIPIRAPSRRTRGPAPPSALENALALCCLPRHGLAARRRPSAQPSSIRGPPLRFLRSRPTPCACRGHRRVLARLRRASDGMTGQRPACPRRRDARACTVLVRLGLASRARRLRLSCERPVRTARDIPAVVQRRSPCSDSHSPSAAQAAVGSVHDTPLRPTCAAPACPASVLIRTRRRRTRAPSHVDPRSRASVPRCVRDAGLRFLARSRPSSRRLPRSDPTPCARPAVPGAFPEQSLRVVAAALAVSEPVRMPPRRRAAAFPGQSPHEARRSKAARLPGHGPERDDTGGRRTRTPCSPLSTCVRTLHIRPPSSVLRLRARSHARPPATRSWRAHLSSSQRSKRANAASTPAVLLRQETATSTAESALAPPPHRLLPPPERRRVAPRHTADPAHLVLRRDGHRRVPGTLHLLRRVPLVRRAAHQRQEHATRMPDSALAFSWRLRQFLREYSPRSSVAACGRIAPRPAAHLRPCAGTGSPRVHPRSRSPGAASLRKRRPTSAQPVSVPAPRTSAHQITLSPLSPSPPPQTPPEALVRRAPRAPNTPNEMHR